MTERPGEPEPTHPFLAKPASPSGEAPGGTPTPAPPSPYGAPDPYGAPPPQTTPYPAYQPYGAAPGMAPAPGPYVFAQAHSGANTAMGLGIASIVCAILTPFCYVTAPGILCAPFAIVLGLRAQKDMRTQPGRYNNEGAAMTGLITGIVGSVIGVGVIALVVFVIGFLFSLS